MAHEEMVGGGAAGSPFAVERVRRGLSQKAAAKRAGISPSLWSVIERGRRWPTDRSVLAVAKALDVDPLDVCAWALEVRSARREASP